MADTPKATDLLTKAATEFATAKAGQVISNLGERASGAVSKATGSDDTSNGDENGDENGDDQKGFIGNTAEKLGEGSSPVGAAVKGLGSTIKEKVTGLFSRKSGSKRPHNIVEDAFIGVPPDVCFEAFTTWEEFPSFMKGPESVTRGDEVPEDDLEEGQHPLEGEQTNWQAKIFINRRSWKATTVDYDPPKRVSWTSEGAKGTVDGTVTFTPVGENATLLLMVLEYRSKGPIEWIGQRWQTVGRRSRLDLKHFKRYVMRTEPDELPEPEEPIDEEPTEEPTEEQPDEEEPTDEGEFTDEEQPDEEQPDEPDEPDEGDEGEPTDEEEFTDEEGEEEPVEEEPEPAPARRSMPRRRPRAGASS